MIGDRRRQMTLSVSIRNTYSDVGLTDIAVLERLKTANDQKRTSEESRPKGVFNTASHKSNNPDFAIGLIKP